MDQLDRIEAKLDNLAERLVAIETDQKWLKGTIKLGVPVVSSIIGYLIIQLFAK
jgi:hypothetical protein